MSRSDTTLIALVESAVNRFGDRTAYRCMGVDTSFAQFGRDSARVRNALQEWQLPADARVAVMLPNVAQTPISIAGIVRAGHVVVTVNPLFTARELAFQLNDAEASVLIVLENFAHVVARAQQEYGLPHLRHVVITQLGDAMGIKGRLINLIVRYVKRMVPAWSFPTHWTVHRWNDLMRRPSAGTSAQRHPDEIAFLQYTGGTTGRIKGAMLSHANLLSNIDHCAAWLQPDQLAADLARETARARVPPGSDTALADAVPSPAPLTMVCALPLYHIFSLTACMLLGLQVGFRNLLLPNPKDLNAVIATLAGTPAHLFPGVTTLFNALLNHPHFDRINLSELRIAVGGGMSVSASVARRWKERTGVTLLEGYGLSETSPVVAATPRSLDRFTGSVGLPMPDTEVVLIDESGVTHRGRSTDITGEIAVRGPQVMRGYWNAPEENAQAFTHDGFFKTGDIGTWDADGYLHIVDRKKDMILVSGFNVYPNEIEQVVSDLPDVVECAAIGEPDDHTGEAVVLFVVPRDPGCGPEVIHQHCARHLTNYKRPKRIVFTTSLPKSTVGKVLRRALRTARPEALVVSERQQG